MPLPPDEPTSLAAVSQWVRAHARAHDRFASVYDASEAHRQEHGVGCTVYPTANGPLLGVLVQATGAKRILEVGGGLGYSALWLADAALPDGAVESIEKEPAHIELARRHVDGEGFADVVTFREGRGLEVMPGLSGPYDLIFSDGDLDEYEGSLDHFIRLLRPGGLLVTSNLFLGQYTDDLPEIAQAINYRRRILDDPRIRTAFTITGLALSVRMND